MDCIRSFPFRISKVTDKRLTIVASTTDIDAYGTRMTPAFYDNCIARAGMGFLGIPDAFRTVVPTDLWKGGLPYVTLSHLEPKQEEGIVGFVENMYVDGDYLKTKASVNPRFPKTDALLNALKSSQEVGASIRFVDLAHRHVIGDQVVYEFIRSAPQDVCQKCVEGREEGEVVEFSDGILIHVGITTIPANSNTSVALEDRSLIGLFEEDAKAIIGEDFEEIRDLYEQRVAAVEERTEDGNVPDPEDPEQEQAVEQIDDFDEFDEDDIPYYLGWEDEGEDVFEDVFENEGTEEERAQIMKREADCYHPKEHYLVVEDPKRPSTWHLPYRDCHGELDWRRIGAAHAALTVGFRGRKYKGPQAKEALQKVIQLYHEHGKPAPGEDAISRAALDEVRTLQNIVDSHAQRLTDLEAALREFLERFMHGPVSVNRLQPEENRVEQPSHTKALTPQEIARSVLGG